MSEIEPLDDNIVIERESALRCVLENLSEELNEDESPIRIENAALCLVNVYNNGYRQMYSEIYLMLDSICGGDEYYLTALLENMELLRIHIKKQWYEDKDKSPEDRKYPAHLYGCVLKLNDHLSLEYQRHSITEGLYDRVEEIGKTANRAEKILNELEPKIKEARTDAKETHLKIQRMQSEAILILAIFAAIIMAFSGGLTFMGNALAGMKDTDPYKLSFVILLCGIIMFNVISYLLHAINKIVIDFYEEEKYHGLRKFFVKGASKHWFVLVFDILLFVLLGLNLLLWYHHANS